MNKQTTLLIVLTFLGMVGLYVILFRAYQLYKEKTAQGTVGGILSAIAGTP